MESYGLLIVIAFVVVSAAMVVLLFYLREFVGHRLRMRQPNYDSLQCSLQRTADDTWHSVAAARSEQELLTEPSPAEALSEAGESRSKAGESRDDVVLPEMNVAADGMVRVS